MRQTRRKPRANPSKSSQLGRAPAPSSFFDEDETILENVWQKQLHFSFIIICIKFMRKIPYKPYLLAPAPWYKRGSTISSCFVGGRLAGLLIRSWSQSSAKDLVVCSLRLWRSRAGYHTCPGGRAYHVHMDQR
jgi:hypothetical protein